MTDIQDLKFISILRHYRQLDPLKPVQTLMKLAQTHGSIFRLKVVEDLVVISSQELVHEVCDDSRFDKKVFTALHQIRRFAGDGLFTAFTEEANWGKAHRILMPAFGPASLRNMFEPMLDIADQMLTKWERFGEASRIDVCDNMTRLTLDTIALAAFDYRFNSFYEKDMHPFIDAMVRGLAEAGARGRRPVLGTKLLLGVERQFQSDAKTMHAIADAVIAERRLRPKLPSAKNDLLSIMLAAKDPLTGEGLDDINIRHQLVTFLIAGHETTSGLLSFALYHMLKDPQVLARAQAEVDAVIGQATPRFEDLKNLTYLDQILKESLRLWPTAPAFGRSPREETTIGGRYRVRPGQVILVLLPMLHRDPKVWRDPERFDPERMAAPAMKDLPAHAWKPFGTGIRACIGSAFAMQEASLVLAMMLQRFRLRMEDASYKLDVKETLTLKPEGFYLRFQKRQPMRPKPVMKPNMPVFAPTAAGAVRGPSFVKGPLFILYGSNCGSSEAFARRIVAQAEQLGIEAVFGSMDSMLGKLPPSGTLVFVTASYEGRPPRNARAFVSWLQQQAPDTLKAWNYAVFGCGNRDWSKTYQAIPKDLDIRLAEAGAQRLMERGEADAKADFFGAFEAWHDRLWQQLLGGGAMRQMLFLEDESSEGQASRQKTVQPDLAVPVLIRSHIDGS